MRGKSTRGDCPLIMKEAELIIVNGMDCAFALKYSPGETPRVLLKGKKEEARDIIWSAQELEIPIIEMTSLDDEFFSLLVAGEEIPESLYKPIAQALALLYKTKSSPHRVLFIRPLRQRPGLLRKKAQEMVDQYSSFLDVSLVSLGLGKELYEQADALKEPLDALRQRIALEIGIVMPEIRVNHSSRCASFAYSIKMREVAVYHGEVDGINEGKDHIFQIIAKLRALIVTQAWQLLGYSEVEALLDRMKKYNPSLYKELFPRYFTVPALRFVLRNLLREGISIRDLSKILEIIKDNLHRTRDPDLLTEFVRAAFAPYLCNKYKNDEGYIEALLLDPVIETMVINSIKESSQVRWLDLTPEDGLRLLTSLGDEMKKNQEFGLNPVLLCSPGLRRFLKRLLETSFPDLPVLSYNEIAPFSEVRSVGMVK